MIVNSSSPNVPPGLLNFGSQVALIPVACALWGASCVQLFFYFINYSSTDRPILKWTAFWTWSADTAHMVAALYGFYMLTAKHWGDVEYVGTLNLAYVWSLLLTTLVSSPVQLFFAYRLWMFSGRRNIFIAILPLVIAQPGLLTAFTVTCYSRDTTTNATLYMMQNLPVAAWSIAAGCDILITFSLLGYLWKSRNQPLTLSGFHSSKKTLDRMTVLTINTGVWTAIVSLLTMILLVALPEDPAFTAVSFLMGPLYCNTLLANLNSRGYLRSADGDSSDVVFNHTFGSTRTQTQRESRNSDIVNLVIIQNDTQFSRVSVANSITNQANSYGATECSSISDSRKRP
ncbi:hypothetical protein K435DRAFT_968222 [Dendrothele bispora CBS 962.96]|uniref:DUF6534 domain-containing protein n=1 Tax=Dendrothele bispora (strain CBS 962.96) TaxID=1314807 RepID=A0A4S8LPR4_DENBC|nr:hypothetical protein K435DRAFT_968222 [Dendrothele bispora CBS 962.96]